jgi:hypothetical protein
VIKITCSIGLIDGNYIYMGSDSGATADDWVERRKTPKVFIKDDFIVCHAGSFKFAEIFQYSFVIPKHPKNMSTEIYMKSKFINSLQGYLAAYGAVLNDFERGIPGLSFLIGYQNQLFDINLDLHVGILEKPYAAIGSGAAVALGSLYSTEDLEPEYRIEKALEASAYYNNTVYPPFHIMKL